MSDAERLVQRLFIEAAEACGDDPRAVARYVAARVAEMSPDDQRLFAGVAEAASAYDDSDRETRDKTH